MAAMQNFRKSLNGFNRQDVVQYIEFMNNKHTTQLNQLKIELQSQKEELEVLRSRPEPDATLPARLEAAEQEKADLESQLQAAREEAAALQAQLEEVRKELAARPAFDELETYRRAERFERMAGERVAKLYDEANGALSRATVSADETAARIGQMADAVNEQLQQMQEVLSSGKQTIRSAADAMSAIRPLDPEA